jgi:proteasome lid subunit RPN8/RPN11
VLASEARLRDGSALATAEAILALRAHALAEHPRECVGLIDRAGAYVLLANLSDTPEKTARADHRELARRMSAGDLRAFCHSHPGGPDCPTASDMRAQMEMEVPFIIVSTNGEATAAPFAWGDELLDERPLVGRSFRHVTDDCYSTIRAWWERERGVLLPDFPREWEWWLDKTPGEKDLYRRYFRDAGFSPVSATDVDVGDVWLAAVRSEVPNHAGVYLGNGLTLHHVSSGLPYDPGRLSKREPVARWGPWITQWVHRPC